MSSPIEPTPTRRRGPFSVLRSLTTANPPAIVTPALTCGTLRSLCSESIAPTEFLEQIVRNSRIETRHITIPLNTPEDAHQQASRQLDERYAQFAAAAAVLIPDAAGRAIKAAGILPSQLTGCIFVTNTGFSAPSMEHLMFDQVGLPPDASYFPLFGLGCGAGIGGLRLAHELVMAKKEAKILLVVIDLSSVHGTTNYSKLDVILHSIFADGCACAVIEASEEFVPGCINIDDTFCQLLPNSRTGIELAIDRTSMKCILAPTLSASIVSGLEPVITKFLLGRSLTLTDVSLWAIHPGGRRILEAAQESLNLSEGDLQQSWNVLRDYGNMLAPSVMFVMKKMIEERQREHDQGLRKVTEPGSGTGEQSPRSQPQLGVALSFSPGVRVEVIKFLYAPSPSTSSISSSVPAIPYTNWSTTSPSPDPTSQLLDSPQPSP